VGMRQLVLILFLFSSVAATARLTGAVGQAQPMRMLIGKKAAAGGARVETDDFNRANEDPLGNGTWTNRSQNLNVTSNAVGAGTNVDSYAFWSAGVAWGNNQYSQCTITSAAADVYNSVGVRMAATGDFGYILSQNGTGLILYYVNSAESWSVIVDYGTVTGLGVGDGIKLTISGTTLTAYHDDGAGFVQVGSTQTHSSITSGSPGIAVFRTSTTPCLDNWEGGEL